MVSLADNTSMTQSISISNWLNKQLAQGSYSFTVETLKKALAHKTDISITRGLANLSLQEKILSISKGFYIIIPPSYQNRGVLPPSMFIDQLMKSLNRPYYVSLLSAAALHGAAHQQPQSHFVCTNLPSMRSTKKKGIHIHYISKRNFSSDFVIQKNTESGYINISNPLLTTIDLINYHKSIGGLNRASTVINDMAEHIDAKNINKKILSLAPKSDLQRLGFLWEYKLGQSLYSDILYSVFKKASIQLRTNKLSSGKAKNSKSQTNRWKINENSQIEIDQ